MLIIKYRFKETATYKKNGNRRTALFLRLFRYLHPGGCSIMKCYSAHSRLPVCDAGIVMIIIRELSNGINLWH